MTNILPKIRTAAVIGVIVTILAVITVFAFGLGKNDDQNWQLKQSVSGVVTIIDTPGWYVKLFATIWTYPRSIQRYFSASTDEGGDKDESIRGTFNDGGHAQFSTMVRFQTPIEVDFRRKSHQDFSGNSANMIESVRAHLVNCVKNTAPLMSASEHQSARKAEFTELVHKQLADGLFDMVRVEKELKDRTDENGEAIMVMGTEIVTDEKGMPIISQVSPLQEYGIRVLQFSITGTDYDPETLSQFKAKKSAYLNAEKSKAEREQEVQERLMIEERGRKEIVEIEITANKLRKTEIINAEKEKEMAEISAAKMVAVAQQAKLEATEVKERAEIEAEQKLEVAKFARLAAEEKAQEILVLASAEEERIIKAGALTEREQGLAEIAAKRDAMVAAELSKIQVPQALFTGGGGQGQGGNSLMENLINLKLMEGAGILDTGKKSIDRAIAPQPVPVK